VLLLGASIAQFLVVEAPVCHLIAVRVRCWGASLCSTILLKTRRQNVAEAVLLLVRGAIFDRALALYLACAAAHIALESVDLGHQLVVALLQDHMRLFHRAVLDFNLLEHSAGIVVFAQLVALRQGSFE